MAAKASALDASSEFCNITVQRNLSTPVSTSSERLATLMAWCLTDDECVDAFRLDPARPNLGVFTHLIPDTFVHLDLMAPLADLVCRLSDGGEDDAQRQLWIPRLIAYRRTQGMLCDIDHTVSIDAETHEQQCVCLPDRPCGQATNNATVLYVVFALLAFLGVGLFGLSVYKSCTLLRRLNQVTGSEQAGLRAVFDAGKGG
jgi:hypothetical protein